MSQNTPESWTQLRVTEDSTWERNATRPTGVNSLPVGRQTKKDGAEENQSLGNMTVKFVLTHTLWQVITAVPGRGGFGRECALTLKLLQVVSERTPLWQLTLTHFTFRPLLLIPV